MLELQPDEIYNLGAQSHVRVSFDQPVYTLQTVGVGALNVLEAARLLNKTKPVKVYQASSSEMYGDVPSATDRSHSVQSSVAYACAKVYAFHQTVNYRRGYNLFASNGILFNHESERRGETFVTRKITRAAGRIKAGMQKKLYLGNIDAKRDWGYARTMSKGCGAFCSTMSLTILCWRPARPVACVSSLSLVFGHLDLKLGRYVEIDPRYFPTRRSGVALG